MAEVFGYNTIFLLTGNGTLKGNFVESHSVNDFETILAKPLIDIANLTNADSASFEAIRNDGWKVTITLSREK